MHSAFSRALMFALAITVTASSGLSQEPDRQVAVQSSLPDAPQPSQKAILLGMPKDVLHDQARNLDKPCTDSHEGSCVAYAPGGYYRR